MLSDLSNSGSMAVLEQVMRFAGQRQRILAHNIANIATPGFDQRDVSIPGFQKALSDAIDERRARTGGSSGDLVLRESDELQTDDNGHLRLVAKSPSGGVLTHDKNNRNLERLMQGLAENAAVYRVASDLMRSRNETLRIAISQRV